ncbi:hypothetical protein B0H10DRAFT_2115135 [Mycena sp. CBHHK59/15]|nr:hypothetical protein B0H10DRAFT_2115135 [Mycena sp. CBHHK59/15]
MASLVPLPEGALHSLATLRDVVRARLGEIENMDPNLDPALIVPQRRARPDDNDDELDDPARSSDSLLPPASGPEDLLFTLESGRAYKKQKKLSAASDLICEEFLKSNNPVKHQFMLLTVALQCFDVLTVLSQDTEGKQWMVPPALKKTATDYARVAALSPSARSYRGKSLAAAVVAAMRERNVSDLPRPDETSHCEAVLELVGTALTQARHGIKAALVDSILACNRTDIATLTRVCIGKSKAQPTAALYRRLAWLRFQLVQQNAKPATTGSKVDKFWVKVDTELDEWHESWPDKRALDCAFGAVYDSDLATYKPMDPKLRVTPAHDVEDWLNEVHTQTGLVAN